MAILTVSRQIASLGDEICAIIANKLGYRFIGRRDLEKRIIRLGFPKKLLPKYDEKKPGFFAALTKTRDEYLDYLQTAILEAAAQNDCIMIGRGSYIILKDIPNHLSFRFISDERTRLERLQRELGCDEKTARKRIAESDANRLGFHKSYFNFDCNDPSMFHMVINTGFFNAESLAEGIARMVRANVTEEIEEIGQKKIEEQLIGQRIVNMLIFDYDININFLRAEIRGGKKIILHGIADSSAVVERALLIAMCELPSYEIKSAIRVAQDFKAYQE